MPAHHRTRFCYYGKLSGCQVDASAHYRARRHVPDIHRAYPKLVSTGAETVVVTRGTEGAVVSRGTHVTHIPAFIVDAIDSTGAGDTFNGALACGLAEGLSIEEAVEMAAAAGALATTGYGAQAAMPARGDIDRLRRTGVRRMPPRG